MDESQAVPELPCFLDELSDGAGLPTRWTLGVDTVGLMRKYRARQLLARLFDSETIETETLPGDDWQRQLESNQPGTV